MEAFSKGLEKRLTGKGLKAPDIREVSTKRLVVCVQ
jgi:hypothetical protein